MRSKEDAQDYRYFPDPDLPPLMITDEWIARVKAGMPELPVEMKARFAEQYLLYAADAAALTATRATAEYFTQAMDALAKTPGVPYSSQGNDATNGKVVANWVINELGALLNNHQTDIANVPIPPAKLAELIAETDRFKATISHKAAKDVLAAMWSGEGNAVTIIAAKGLAQISDAGAIEKLVDDVLAASPAIVAEVKAGREKAFNSLVGKVMAASKGKANPAQVNAILKKKLG
jgi:aspartyl-tRNA(Asn)/glutamyl-tRNA(Gln) amidotransferase subunit B